MKTSLWFALVLGAVFASGKVIITKPGQSVTMACGISTFKNRLEWRHENVRIIETFVKSRLPRKGQTAIAERSRLIGMSLFVSKVQQEDAGTFTCEADGKSEQHTLVVVSVLVSPSSQVQLGSEATLQCQVRGLLPKDTVQWIRPDESPGSKSQTHTLTSVARSDAGTWKCKVSHSGEEFTYNLELKITEPARVTTSSPAPPKNAADTNKPSCSTCVSHGPRNPDQLLGLSWWMWVVIGGGCLIVVLLMVLVICLCKKIKRKKRKLRMQKIQNGRQPRQYCQCNRPTAAAKPQQGRRREKPSALPLQPLLLE